MRTIIKALFLLSFSLVILSFISCEKSMDDAVASRIIGKWQWVKTTNPYSGNTTDPGTAGYTQTFEFSTHGFFREYRNGIPVRETSYRVEAVPKDQGFFVLIYGGFNYHCSISGENLEFNDAYVDGPVILFTRLR
jgi:hypothetical protein